MMDLDSQIGPDHLARLVWAFVAGLDLSPLYARIKARDAVAGRPAPDPRVLLALWLYATLDGVGSARALARLCRAPAALRWPCGGVPVNYPGLSDFRPLPGPLLYRTPTASVTGLWAEGLVDIWGGADARPSGFAGAVALCHARWRGFGTGAGAAVPGARCLSLAVRRRAGELSRSERLPHAGRRAS